MAMPYQCIKRCGKVLVAARGSSIDTFNPENGYLLSTWNAFPTQDPNLALSEKAPNHLETQKSESSADTVTENSPPAKRRKLSAGEEDSPAAEPNQKNGMKKDGKGSKKGNRRSDAVASGLETPAVILLEATRDGRHVIAVTGEDKSIRVFQQDEGYLKQLSQRTMPKRPCAIAITGDDATIISADKFGDVYSLPLLISETPDFPLKPVTPTAETTAKPFVPAANTLTVHSQRNRKALENQKKHQSQPKEKTEPSFEHTLLLGHVSMLTDLTLVELEGRCYILTADRDEHIRVSRGIPMAHVIEGFCLGHTEFISRLCVPDCRPEVLISGGGDNELFVWEWVKGVVLSKADLRGLVLDVMKELGGEGENGSTEALKFAVSGITHVRQRGNEGVEDLVLVTVEGVPAMFTFLLTTQNELQLVQTLELSGNVLDIATVAGALVLSIDTIHKPGSMTDRREPSAESIDPLPAFHFQGRQLVPSVTKFKSAKNDVEDNGRLTNLMYGLENLRKRDDGREED